MIGVMRRRIDARNIHDRYNIIDDRGLPQEVYFDFSAFAAGEGRPDTILPSGS